MPACGFELIIQEFPLKNKKTKCKAFPVYIRCARSKAAGEAAPDRASNPLASISPACYSSKSPRSAISWAASRMPVFPVL